MNIPHKKTQRCIPSVDFWLFVFIHSFAVKVTYIKTHNSQNTRTTLQRMGSTEFLWSESDNRNILIMFSERVRMYPLFTHKHTYSVYRVTRLFHWKCTVTMCVCVCVWQRMCMKAKTYAEETYISSEITSHAEHRMCEKICISRTCRLDGRCKQVE